MVNSDLVYGVSYKPVFQGNRIVKRFSWVKVKAFFDGLFTMSLVSFFISFLVLLLAYNTKLNSPYLVVFNIIGLTSIGLIFVSVFSGFTMDRVEKRENKNLKTFFAQYETVTGPLKMVYKIFSDMSIAKKIFDRKESFTHLFHENVETTFALGEDGIYTVSFRKDGERVDVPEVQREQDVDIVGLMSQFGDDEAVKLVETIVGRFNVLEVAELSDESQREVIQVADDVADIVLAWQRIWVLDNNVDTKKLVNILSDLLTELTLVTRFEVSSIEDTIVAHGRVISERVKKFEKENFENKTEGL